MTRHLFLTIAVLCAGSAAAAEPAKPAAGPKVSEPMTHANLTIFLLRGSDTVPAGHTFLTLQEAMEQKKVIVHETSEVNELSIENVSADIDVFVQAGDIVRGGKQDRLMASDMIVPPKSGRIAMPSFCCESGRWRQRGVEDTAAFAKSERQAGNKDVKLALNGARSQGRVWDEVKKAQMKLSRNVGKDVADKASPSSYQLSLEDKDLMAKVDAYVQALTKAIDGKDDAIGFAIAINGKMAGADMYGSAALFRKLWPKLLNGAAVDALAEWEKDKKFATLTAKDVETFLTEAAAGKRSEVALASLGGRGQPRQTANVDGRRQAANPAAPTGQAAGVQAAAPPISAAAPARVRITQAETGKTLLLECQDKKLGDAVIHRGYIAK